MMRKNIFCPSVIFAENSTKVDSGSVSGTEASLFPARAEEACNTPHGLGARAGRAQ